MTVGRYIMRGRVYQGRAFAGRALANGGGGSVDVTDVVTSRHTLFGTSLARQVLIGTSTERHTLKGSTPS